MKISHFALLLSLALGHWACTCRYVDCEGPGFKVVHFISQTDSLDLFVTNQYEISDVKISPMLLDQSGSAAYFVLDSVSQTVYLETSGNTLGYILQLDSLAPDTLLFTNGQTGDTPCCGNQVTVDRVDLNGHTLPHTPFDYDIYLVK